MLCCPSSTKVQKITGGRRVIYPKLGWRRNKGRRSRHSENISWGLVTVFEINNAGSRLRAFRIYHSPARARMWSVDDPKIPGWHRSLIGYISRLRLAADSPVVRELPWSTGPRVLETRPRMIQAVSGRSAPLALPFSRRF